MKEKETSQEKEEIVPASHLASIAKGDEDAANGRVITVEEFRKRYARYGL